VFMIYLHTYTFMKLGVLHVLKVDEVVMKNGYAFINCSSRDYAIAGKAFADTGQLALVVNGSLIRVRYSPNRPHSAVLDENSPTCGPQIEPTKNLYVCGLPPQVTQEALGELFRLFGHLVLVSNFSLICISRYHYLQLIS